QLISRQCCADGGCGCSTDCLVQLGQQATRPSTNGQHLSAMPHLGPIADEFFRRVMAEDVSPADVFRITTTSFMDAYNFDVRQAMKDCVHFILPSGHIIPFSAYNLLYRDGLVSLPPLRREFATEITEDTERTDRVLN